MAEEARDHRKFLKQAKLWLEPGDDLPDVEYSNARNAINLYATIRSCLFVVFVDTECEPCGDALNALYSILSGRDWPVAILVATDNHKKFEALQDAFGGMADVYWCPRRDMKNYYGTDATPWGYGVNEAGQVVTSTVCGSRAEWRGLVRPFRKLVGDAG